MSTMTIQSYDLGDLTTVEIIVLQLHKSMKTTSAMKSAILVSQVSVPTVLGTSRYHRYP